MKTKLIDGEYVTIEDIIQKHQRYVHKQANRYSTEASFYGMTKDDLYQAGCIGLIKAFEKYKESKKNKFISFASQYITGYIKREISKSNHLIRLPQNIYDLIFKIKAEGWEEKRAEYIAEKMNLTITRVQTALIYMNYFIGSTEKKISKDENKDMTVLDIVTTGEDFVEDLAIREFINQLDDRERTVLMMLLSGYRITKIGPLLGKSRSYGYIVMQVVKEKYHHYFQPTVAL
ncbi:sigma-70 family RNA polymerase sigma factor [Gracilibacillus sp. JCM 18860]|uniref:sigma-70 family RNA polymerase sigma factor n=1 Tax=Gracilibacillus sp. JCM 18860 TaxID=1306159 RepID=UPI0006D01FCE